MPMTATEVSSVARDVAGGFAAPEALPRRSISPDEAIPLLTQQRLPPL
jgi:hypothetical protein